MPDIDVGRMNAEGGRGFVLFLVGMRFNRLWKVRKWWPAFFAMPKMLGELAADPELGLLGARVARSGRTITVIQYWESSEKIMEFSRSQDRHHRAYWKWFNGAVGSGGDVGIWHELYRIEPDAYEARYVNMPAFGLGQAIGRTPGQSAGPGE
ncbi:DUF4188 domain-containing protein [Streptomyces sp. A7024]|uniref:DUF4188 domain-containing protein n=1 Tax=Streptomyces coryli TaxID=1128680 RepID=A0A6G4U5F1_9ACTN|nr:DUF4188 domain-containing protein [Streptomyces coryli]NGN66970.1 DUF4188 domain-containing protein [Streptomyces coryli]